MVAAVESLADTPLGAYPSATSGRRRSVQLADSFTAAVAAAAAGHGPVAKLVPVPASLPGLVA